MKIRYGLVGFGGIAENRVAKEGFACDKSRFAPLKKAQLVGATDLNPARQNAAAEAAAAAAAAAAAGTGTEGGTEPADAQTGGDGEPRPETGGDGSPEGPGGDGNGE